MHPYFFGDSDRQLYGVYDPPRSHIHKNAGILLCYPVGQEYMRSHWASRKLVSQLCRAGLHCMRFDYYGTGDSTGTDSDAEMRQWRTDVNTGLEEFKDTSGVSKVSMVGLRFGAVLAATAPAQEHQVKQLVLWDPVVNGATYIRNLRSMHQSLLDRLKPIHKGRNQEKNQAIEELVGYRFSDTLVADIEAVNLLNTDKFSASEIILVVSEEQEEYTQLKAHLQSLGLLKAYTVVQNPANWNDLGKFDSALIASEAINAICSELTDQNQ